MRGLLAFLSILEGEPHLAGTQRKMAAILPNCNPRINKMIKKNIEIFTGRLLKPKKIKMATSLGRKVVISASILLRKAWLGSKLGDSGPRNPFM